MAMHSPLNSSRSDQINSLLFVFAGLAALLAFIFMSRDYGITWDEWMDHNNGFLGVRFTLSLGKDLSFMDFWHGYLYTHLFYTVTSLGYILLNGLPWAFLEGGLHADRHILPYFTMAHAFNAFVGWIGIMFTALCAKKLGGWRAGWIALVLMCLSPRYTGNMMNNPKDIPFAAAYITALFSMICFFKSSKTIKLSGLLAVAVSLGMAFGLRIGAVILFFYFALFNGLNWLQQTEKKNFKDLLTHFIGPTFFILGLGYAIGLMFWPYGWFNPVINLFDALKKISDFQFWNHTVLFNGQYYLASELPWYYLPQWILISTPEFFLAGIIIFILIYPAVLNGTNKLPISLLIFSVIFPLATIILKKSIVYDSWRHVFFVYPPLVVLSSLSWSYFYNDIQRPLIKRLVILGGVLLLILPLSWLIQNHPHGTTYFNHISGGLKYNFTRHETDYWCNSMRSCASNLAEQLEDTDQTVVIRSDCGIMSSYPYLKSLLGARYHPYLYPVDFLDTAPYYLPAATEYGNDWDYWLRIPRAQSVDTLALHWPPQNNLYTESASDQTLCTAVKNPGKQN